MVIIDDAGVGCFLGTPIIVGFRPEAGEKVVKYMKHPNQTKKMSKKILNQLKVDKNELILVCHGSYFQKFRVYLQKNNYTFKSCIIDGKAQDIVEDAFMEQLYSLGVSKQVKLHGKEYDQLHEELAVTVVANPELLKHIRYTKRFKSKLRNLLQKIENAIFRYPNLIASLLEESHKQSVNF